MSFWLPAAGLIAVTMLVLLLPLWRQRSQGPSRAAFDRTVYRDQLAEVERDRKRGLLNQEEAKMARLEVERRLLKAAEEAASKSDQTPASDGAKVLTAGLAIALPVAALLLYLELGSPQLPSQPFAERNQGGETPRDLASLVDTLAARLQDNPDDLRGWQLLARSAVELGRYEQASDALQRTIALGDDSAEVYASLGEVIAAANGGSITPAAREAFAAALVRDSGNPRARYYGGLAYAQDGRLEEALAVWQGLAADSPPDAPWLPLLTQQIQQTRVELGLEPGGAPEAEPGPSAEDLAAAGEMTAEERDAFVRAMVERLASRLETEPDDLAGWLRLARAYIVLDERQSADKAIEQAARLSADLPDSAPERQELEALRALLGS